MRRLLWLAVAPLLMVQGCDDTGGDSAGPTARIEGMEGLLPVEGAELYYRVVGHGEPLLVIHGGPGMEHSYLLPGLPEAIPDRALVFFDQRGTGRSTGEVDSTTIGFDQFLADIDAMRAGLGRERVDVLAHSFGGFVAMHYAMAYPQGIDRLILLSTVEPGFRFERVARERQVSRRSLTDQRQLDSLTQSQAFRARDPATVNRIYELSFKPAFADAEKASQLRVAFTARTAENGGAVARLLMIPLGRYDDYGRLAEIRAPTLIVHGDSDLLPLSAADTIAAGIPDARVVAVAGAGHFPWIENPEATRQAVSNFLSQDR